MTTFNPTILAIIAGVIRDKGDSPAMRADLQTLHRSGDDGAEILRQIRLHNIADAGHIVADALYDLL